MPVENKPRFITNPDKYVTAAEAVKMLKDVAIDVSKKKELMHVRVHVFYATSEDIEFSLIERDARVVRKKEREEKRAQKAAEKIAKLKAKEAKRR